MSKKSIYFLLDQEFWRQKPLYIIRRHKEKWQPLTTQGHARLLLILREKRWTVTAFSISWRSSWLYCILAKPESNVSPTSKTFLIFWPVFYTISCFVFRMSVCSLLWFVHGGSPGKVIIWYYVIIWSIMYNQKINRFMQQCPVALQGRWSRTWRMAPWYIP